MATVNKSMSISFQGIQANTVFFDPIFEPNGSFMNYRVIPNVVSKKKLLFVNKLEKIVQKHTGCGFTPVGKFGIYDREIEVDDIKVNIEQCVDEFKDTILEEKLKKGNLREDLNGTEIGNMMLQAVQMGITLDYHRLFWFGDKSSLDPAYNVTDGIWSVYIPQLVNANLTPFTSALSGAPLAAGAATTILTTVYDQQSLALAGLPDGMKKLYVSKSIWNAYRADLENSGGGDAGRQMLIDGTQTLLFRGIMLLENPNWDEYTTNDLGLIDQHEVMLTIPDNLVFATDLMSDLTSVMMFFDPFEEVTKIKVQAKFGTNFVHPSLFSVAFN
tara:strand:+ start:781 stop:1767 length:987 start_codon:yes stop_codon:yes gene_type:complete